MYYNESYLSSDVIVAATSSPFVGTAAGVNEVVAAERVVAGATIGMGVGLEGGTTTFEFEAANPAPFPFNCHAGIPTGRTPNDDTRVGAGG